MAVTTDPPAPVRQRSADAGAQSRIAGASGFLMLAVLASRVLGLIRDHIIATHFGQGFDTDVYNAAFTIPDLIFFLIAGGGLSTAIIPVFTEYMAARQPDIAWRIFKVVAIVTTISVGGLILIGEILAYPLVHRFNPGWPVLEIRAAASLARILLPAQICFFLGGLMMGVLQTRHIMSGQAYGPIVYNGGIIFGALVLTHFMPAHDRIAGLCWGAVLGAVVGNLALQWYLVRTKMGGFWAKESLKELLSEPRVKSGARQVWLMMLPIILGVALPQVAAIANKYYASFLKGSGSTSALMNANRLMQVPLGVFAQAISIAILPTMAAQVVAKNRDALRKTANFGMRFILFLTVPCSVLMIVLALPIVQLLLQGGKYTTDDSHKAALALIYYSVGIFAWSAHSIISRTFYSMKDSRTPVIVGTIVTLLIFLPMNRPLMAVLGFGGLALATSLAAIINMTVLFVLLRIRLRGIEGKVLLAATAKILLATGAMAWVCLALRKAMDARLGVDALVGLPTRLVQLHALSTLVLCTTVSVLIYAALALLFRMEEIGPLRKILRKFRPAGV